jgi:hypothetical protein
MKIHVFSLCRNFSRAENVIFCNEGIFSHLKRGGKRVKKILACVVLCLASVFFLTACHQQDTLPKRVPDQEIFEPAQPSELGKRNYWEIAKTFDLLSREFILAVDKGDEETLTSILHPQKRFSVPEAIFSTEITHIQQQSVRLYENNEFMNIMQVGTATDPYRYLHIFFEPWEGEWKVIDVQIDA